MKGIFTVAGLVLSVVLVFAVSVLTTTLIIWGVWNWVMHPVFGVKTITFWQSALVGVGLSLIGGIIRGRYAAK